MTYLELFKFLVFKQENKAMIEYCLISDLATEKRSTESKSKTNDNMNILQFKKNLKNLSFEEQTDLIKERIDEIITIRKRWSIRMYDCEGEIEDLENRLENLDEDSDEYQDLSYELDGWKEECVDLEEKIAMCDELIHLHHIRQSNAPAMENAET